VSGLEVAALQGIGGQETTQRFASLDWVSVLPETELSAGARKIVERDEFDLLLIRTASTVYATNNTCPHLNLPLNDSEVTTDGAIVGRWYESYFDLETGEIRSWCTKLKEDGTSQGMKPLGNIRKNQRPMTMFPARIADGAVWVAFDLE
jgi:nitrite reductase/ring-hydroxylating ferredoxin subunit